MVKEKNLEGTILREGNFFIGDGPLSLEIYDDTMALAITKTIKLSETVRTIIPTVLTAAATYFAIKYDNPYIGVGAAVLGTVTIKMGFDAMRASKEYSKALNKAVSNGWSTKKELKKIGWRYLH